MATWAGSDFKELFFLLGDDFVDLADGQVGYVLDFVFSLVVFIVGNILVFK